MNESTLSITKKGQRAPLYMLHGWGFSSAVFDEFAEKLSQFFTVKLIDLPGYGSNHEHHEDTDTLDCIARKVIESMPVPGVLLGWSLGGTLATYIAATYPQKVIALITIASNLKFIRSDDWPHAITNETIEKFSLELSENYEETIGRFLTLNTQGNEALYQKVKQLKRLISQNPSPKINAIETGLSVLKDTDLRPLLRHIRCPVKQIFGEKDVLVPKAAATQSEWLYPGLQTDIIKGASHAPFLSHTDEVVNSIEVFYDERVKHTEAEHG